MTGIPASSSTSSLHSASTPQARAPRPVFPNAAVEAAASSPSLGSTHKSFAKPSPTKSDHGTHAAEQALAASAQSGVAMSAATMAVLSAQLKTSSLQERLLRMRETDVKLEDTKKKFGTAMDVIKSGQDQFRLKQKEMRETISQFEKFVIDQDNKIVKAEKTAEQEAKIVAQHRATISGLVKTISEKRAEKTRVEHDLRRLARNRQYLVSVVHEMAPDGDDDDVRVEYFVQMSLENTDLMPSFFSLRV
jgi:myosin heavy subunit